MQTERWKFRVPSSCSKSLVTLNNEAVALYKAGDYGEILREAHSPPLFATWGQVVPMDP